MRKIWILFLFAVSCKKAEFIPAAKYFKLNIDAFYADSALFSSVSVNHDVVQNTSISQGYTKMINKEFDSIPGDSAKMKLVIVKNNSQQINFDTIIHFTNYNDFLFFQPDPSLRPMFINKRTEASTAIKPGKDSVKIRFFFNKHSNIRTPGNTVVNTIDLQLYSSRRLDFANNTPPQKYLLIKNIKVNAIGNYLSFYNGDDSMQYGFQLLSGSTVVQDYEWSTEDGFVKGVLAFKGDGVFRTIQIRQSEKEGEFSVEPVTGINADYIFGFN